jgi:fructose-bisphosphate aldolase class II
MLLTPVQARTLFEYCVREKFAVLAVNADSPAALYDCLTAARNLGAPIMIETSQWQLEGISFGAGDPGRGLALYFAHLSLLASSEEFAHVPVALHTDHIRGPRTREILQQAVEGYPFLAAAAPAGATAAGNVTAGPAVRLSPSSISLDASKLTPEENIELMCSLIETAKACGRPVTLEMEAGLDSGYTTPEEVEKLVMGVEGRYPGYLALFAPGLGNRHGFSKDGYPDFRPETVEANAKLVRRLTGRPVGIVLHGSSGLSEEQVRRAVAHGLTKMNWSTDGLILRSAAAREYYETHRKQLVPGHGEFKETSMDNGVGLFVSERFVPRIESLIRLLGGEGMAARFVSSAGPGA